MAIILLLTFSFLVIANVPIGICLGLATAVAILVAGGKVPLILVAQRMFTGLDSFPLLAIPLFMIAGKVMERGGISRCLIDLAAQLVGWLPGGFAMVSVLACMFFAAISGSAPATVAAIGSIMVPAMIEAGYDRAFAAGLLAAAGTIGVIIPPSIPFVTYGITMNTSIGDLFLAGFIPGIIMGLSLMIYSYYVAKKRGYLASIRPTLKGFLTAFKEAIWGLLMPIIILGGIYGGVFTPTEAAGIACVYGVIVSLFVYKDLKVHELPKVFYDAGVTSAMVMLIIATATAMGWVLTTEQVPARIAQRMAPLATNQVLLLLVINVILLITGCLMELNAAIVILGPILLPLVEKANINLIHFGVMMVVNMALGLLTPPLGVNLFVACGLERSVTFNKIVQAVFPMLIILIIDLMLFTYLPQLSLLLPNLL